MAKAAKPEVRVKEGIPPKVVTMIEELTCDLNEVEWQNKARELADSNRQVTFLEDHKKSVMADMNSDIKDAKLNLGKLTNVVANRREMREVAVEVTYDYDLGTVTKVRTDTKEVINTRKMGDNERQGELELMDANHFIESRDKGDSKDGVAAEETGKEASSKEV